MIKSKSSFTVLVTIVTLLAVLVGSKFAPLRIAHADNGGTVLASSSTTSLLQFPEGLTSWQGKVYVATYNVNSGASNHILVFDASTGKLLNTLGDQPGQQDISAGPINGLTIDQSTGDLYAAANVIGYILRIHNPGKPNAQVSRYSHFPNNGGPEDMAWDRQGDLYASDSTLGLVYRIPPGGAPTLVIVPVRSGAPVRSDRWL